LHGVVAIAIVSGGSMFQQQRRDGGVSAQFGGQLHQDLRGDP
jgi:hypothetical protein